MGNNLVSGSPEKALELKELNKIRSAHSGIFLQLHNIVLRMPYLIEDKLGIDMRYYCALNAPAQLITLEERRLLKANEIDDLKALVFREMISLDDPIDIYSKHTLLHDAVMLDKEQVFYFLLQQGANPMVRDANGYTPLLKAAALCRTDYVHYLVEK